MIVLTLIAGIPLYSTVQEAIAWARANGLSGFHTHSWQTQTGYMGGSSHYEAMQAMSPTTRTTTTTTTGGGMSGGGGGGY